MNKKSKRRLYLGEIIRTEDGKGFQLNERFRPDWLGICRDAAILAIISKSYKSGDIKIFKYTQNFKKIFPPEEVFNYKDGAKSILNIMMLALGPEEYVGFTTSNKRKDALKALEGIREIIQYKYVKD